MAVLTRAQWGAGPHRAGTIRTPVARLFLHHTVTGTLRGAAAGRNLQAIARSRGFADVSYSWLVDVGGTAIEGRGWGRQGAHTAGHNSTSHAISLVGNFDTSAVPAAMERGIVRRVRDHRRYGPGRITHSHSDVSATACPGRHARARVLAINAAAGTSPTGGFLMSLTAAEQRELLALAREVRGVTNGFNNRVAMMTATTVQEGLPGWLMQPGVKMALSDWLRSALESENPAVRGPLEDLVRRVIREERGDG